MGGKFDKTCGKRIKLDQKFDAIGYHRDQDRISDIRIGYHSDRSEISESDRIIVRAAQRISRFTLQSKGFCQPLFVFLLLGLIPAMFFSDRYEKKW